ncbi:hypothetical protein LPJ61_004280 [Coemansia biformis]|uniref:Pyridoxamine 5'-phosphate oxidase Alr4036 family FMN-binding domain-containing protein n=1 Tax=Coemansia biformis TaxID=1286918 RepID=A0A9W7Y9L4_9FUNG|nr:hypothetical protein LPJ61_004280 [Coemansia biformis]
MGGEQCGGDPEWKRAFVEFAGRERAATGGKPLEMALATVDLDGQPAVRMVGLRGFLGDEFLRLTKDDSGQWTSGILAFCTHAQSAKVQELEDTSDVQIACWMPHSRVQIRCSGEAHLLFHPDNPKYESQALDIFHRVRPRDGAGGGPADIDDEYIREQAFLHHTPEVQAWYSWPAPGRVRQPDPALYPVSISSIGDQDEAARREAAARRNYVLVFVDVNKVDIVDLGRSTRMLYTRRSDTSWSAVEINP